MAFAVDSNVISVRVESQMFDATVEALYVRALLVDRFAGGQSCAQADGGSGSLADPRG